MKNSGVEQQFQRSKVFSPTLRLRIIDIADIVLVPHPLDSGIISDLFSCRIMNLATSSQRIGDILPVFEDLGIYVID